MIYNLSTSVLVPGKMAEYNELAGQGQPLYPQVGMKIVGSFHGYTGNMNEIYVLYVYEDLVAYQKAREAFRKNPDVVKIMSRVSPLLVSSNYTLLEPNAWSPMK